MECGILVLSCPDVDIMNRKLCPKIILEGTRLTMKTDIAFALNEHPRILKNYFKDFKFTWLEQRIKPLGFHLVFVTRSQESFDAARRERLKVSGNPGQYDDLSIFVDEQHRMRELVAESNFPVLNLDISDNNIQMAVDRIADWLEDTGGLWME